VIHSNPSGSGVAALLEPHRPHSLRRRIQTLTSSGAALLFLAILGGAGALSGAVGPMDAFAQAAPESTSTNTSELTPKQMVERGQDLLWSGQRNEHANEAADLFRRAAQAGNAEGMVKLIELLAPDQTAAPTGEAARWFARVEQAAIDTNDYMAMFDIAHWHRRGAYGLPASETEKFLWLGRAANLGHYMSIVQVASSYENGEGVTQNPAEALRVYLWLASHGHAEYYFNVGAHYWDGKGVERDRAQAVRYWRQAGDSPVANYYLGLAYRDGDGVAKDTGQAARYFQIAVNGSDVESMVALAILYYNGDGVAKDEARAEQLLRAAGAAADLPNLPYHVELRSRINGLLAQMGKAPLAPLRAR
jgi:TPR repeat protein